MKKLLGFIAVAIAWLSCPALSQAQGDAAKPPPMPPQIAEASNEAELAITGFQIPAAMRAEPFAAEPLLANPVAFCIDPKGRFFVAETFRQEKGVEDNRSHMDWLLDDLAAQTVEDRLDMYRRHLGERAGEYRLEDDRIRRIEDLDGDGRADRSTVFADGFNGSLEGTGAGLLARDGNVYYANIPNFWRLSDEDGDGRADVRDSLHYGFGVRVAFRGHDLHGPIMGPDGRLYFSIGDRGFNVTTKEGQHLARPDTGAVFRCEPDGAELEVFAYGLRNPQELAFDDYGNLFTGDNNSDSGDRARLVYVVEGGDSGWRMYYQYLQDRGPWNRERMWYPYRSDSETEAKQPAFLVPPIANLADGPAGLTYYPGVGLPERYRGHFFLADFRGDSGRSGIRSFTVREKGASFELADSHEFIWRILATDVDFGYDGALYVSDWVNGWVGPGKGRLYRFSDPKYADEVLRSGSARLMREGFAHRTALELANLLEHPDRRIRLEAQFALVEQKADDVLSEVAISGDSRPARIHGIWGLGQLARKDSAQATRLIALFQDKDAEVRAQTARVCADNLRRDHGQLSAELDSEINQALVDLLNDSHARVRFFAAIALGKLGRGQDVAPLLALLIENNERDPLLRHAAVMGLAGIAGRDLDALLSHRKHPHASARMGVLLALRRLKRPEIGRFLNDSEADLVLEAARAIHDEPIAQATPSLARLAERRDLPDALLRRVMNANFRLGKEPNARALIALADSDAISEALQLEALEALRAWTNPPPLDRVLGDWRPLEARSAAFMPELLEKLVPNLLGDIENRQLAGIQLATQYELKEFAPQLDALLRSADNLPAARAEALRALENLQFDDLEEAAEQVIRNDPDASVRSAGRRVLAKVAPDEAVGYLIDTVENGETVEKQTSLEVLASLKTPEADRALEQEFAKLIAGEVPVEIQLDLIEAARSRGTAVLQEKLERFESARSSDDSLSGFRECLAGGSTERGRILFFGRAEASCRRCHQVDGQGAAIGPDLSGIGAEKTREYLLEALVAPDRQIAKGFETAVLVTYAGKVYSGIVKQEDDKQIHLMTPEGEIIVLDKNEIDERTTGKSGMPDDAVRPLSKSDLRDLVEYLASLKKPATE